MPYHLTCSQCGAQFTDSHKTRKYCSQDCAVRGRFGTVEQRFWSRVDQSGECWLWTGSVRRSGYGLIKHAKSGIYSAHRLSWYLHFGSIPKGMSVLHKCDNPACVRPDHLFLGTVTDNNRDRDRKGRTARGERTSRSKLTASQVRRIRQRMAAGERNKELAAEYGVDPSVMSRIRHRKYWRHIR